jgi:hypothetical protein
MRQRPKFLADSRFRAALTACLVFLMTGAVLLLVRPDRRIAWLQNYAAIFFLAVIALLVLSRKACPADENADDKVFSLHPALIFVLPVLAYLPALWVYFVSDDFAHLAIARLPLLPFLAQQLTQGQVTGSGYHLFFRPLGFASLVVDYRLFHYWAPGYHLVNLALHLAVVAGVYFLSLGLGLSRKMAAVAAALFSIAPVTVQPVTYIAARFDLIATALGVWSFVAYLRFRKTGSFATCALALLLFFLGTFAKESIYVLPLLILWLELVAMPVRRWKAALAFLAVAAAAFAYRLHALHGIGGYEALGGSPAVLALGRKALVAVFLRGPAETLLAFNWHQPPVWRVVAIAAAATAVLLSLLLLTRPGPHPRRLAWFALGWIVIAILPAHSLLWTFDQALLWSRVLYISAIGLAILLATLLSGIPDVRLRHAWTVLLLICFLLGLWHNLSAWRSNTTFTREFLTALPRLLPSPPPRSEFVIADMPIELCGVRFFLTGLTPAVQLAYGRDDLSARRPYEPPLHNNGPTIPLRWTGRPPDFVSATPASPQSSSPPTPCE